MKKLIIIAIVINLFSCGTTKSKVSKPLFEVLSENSYGGTKFEFYEILTEANEIKMLLNDPEMKGLVQQKDIETSNFLILNLGEKKTGGFSIGIESVVETDKNIEVVVKKTGPKRDENVTYGFTSPFCVVKINSKKEIVFK